MEQLDLCHLFRCRCHQREAADAAEDALLKLDTKTMYKCNNQTRAASNKTMGNDHYNGYPMQVHKQKMPHMQVHKQTKTKDQ